LRRPDEVRETTVTAVDEKKGNLHDAEGYVPISRLGIDWELAGTDAQVNMVVVKTAAGPVLATVLNMVREGIDVYSDAMTPPGAHRLPHGTCGKVWDWLKGRTLSVAAADLSVVFEPGAAKKKRGPKPRGPAVTAETAALPAAPAPTVSASDGAKTTPRIFTFEEKAMLWHAARKLQKAVSSDEPPWLTEAIPEALREMDDLLTQIVKGGGYVA
jgi:hypothetical protein